MAIIVLLICFSLLVWAIGAFKKKEKSLKEIVLQSILIFSVILLFITETTSYFQLLNFQSILISWIVVTLIISSFLVMKRTDAFAFAIFLKERIVYIIQSPNRFQKRVYLFLLVALILIFMQGILYPPNNWNSMTYHMARISNWISQQSVAHYPTHIIRQVYQPPFSEFVILHFNVLSEGD